MLLGGSCGSGGAMEASLSGRGIYFGVQAYLLMGQDLGFAGMLYGDGGAGTCHRMWVSPLQ